MERERATKPKKTDRRVLKTRKALFEAFDRLLCTKDYDKITISELAREADIDRKTFYLHYSSIDDMIDDKVDAMVAEILDDVEDDMQRRRDETAENVEPDLHVFFAGVNRAMMEHLPMKEHIFSAMPATMLADRLARPLAKEIRRRGPARIKVEDDVLEIYIASLVGGILGAYSAWIDRGMKVSDERVSDIASRMLGVCVRDFFELGGEAPERGGF